MRVLITGAAGFIGRQVLEQLAVQYPQWSLIAADIQPISTHGLRANVEPIQLDISKSREVKVCIASWKPQVIIHMASVVTPPRDMTEKRLHAIDVGGTRSVIAAAVAEGVEQLVFTSSGAAYGYHPDNAEWISEDQPLRGHDTFAYAKHKREVEQLLANARVEHPQLKQLVLRPGTVLGKQVNNQITELFKKRSVLGVWGYDSRFVFIWDKDVVNVICQGVARQVEGIFNLAGDGALSLKEIAGLLHKPYRPIPSSLIKLGLRIMQPLGLSQYGPEQLDFLRYRPVLSNQRLKQEFGYTPRYTSLQAFEEFLRAQGNS
ncbi:MAG: epimerase [Pseudomonadaceae bacterium]|nr:epimerase [Pseudomonadaceae bacterium]